MTQSIYEQLKDDLGYLKLTRAAELLPALLDRARAEGSATRSSWPTWSPRRPPRPATDA
jgi:hypothetical protein